MGNGGWRRAVWVLAALLSACSAPREKAPTSVQGFLADYGRWLSDDAPELASVALPLVGEDARTLKDTLDDRGALAADLRRTAVLRGMVRLRALDPQTLSAQDRYVRGVLLAHFSALEPGAAFDAGRFSPLQGFRPYVLDPFKGAFATLPRYLAGQHRVRDLAEAEAYLVRLGQVGGAIRAETARARTDAAAGVIPPPALLARILQQTDAMATAPPGETPFAASLRLRIEAVLGPLPADPNAAEVAAHERARALLSRAETLVASEIQPAYRELGAFVRTLLDDQPKRDLQRSQAWRRAGLTYVAGGPVDKARVGREAAERVAQLTQQLDGALRGLGRVDGTPSQRLAAMAAEPRFSLAAADPKALAVIVKARLGPALQVSPAWFSGRGAGPIEVRASASGGGRLLSYEPARGNAEPAVILIGEGLSRLASYELATLAQHEGVPGHHAQASVSRNLQRPPALALIHFPAFSEGWATYAEQLAEEFGVFQNRPEERVGYLHWQLVRAVRLIVDAGLHDQGWSREQALTYFTAATGLTQTLAVDEVDRILAAPGWASAYEIGRRRVSDARARAQLALGPDFDIRAFHEVVLGDGEVSLAIMDAHVDAWVASVQAGKPQSARDGS